MVTLKNLVVGITGNLVFFVYKAFIDWENDGLVLLSDVFMVGFVKAFKNVMKAFYLGLVRTEYIVFIAVTVVIAQVVEQQVKLLVERRLRLYVVFKGFLCLENGFRAKLNDGKVKRFFYECLLVQEKFFGSGMFDVFRELVECLVGFLIRTSSCARSASVFCIRITVFSLMYSKKLSRFS